MDDDDIESYWEDIRFYPPKPVDPIIQLRGEDLFRKEIAESLGLSFEDVRHLSFEAVGQLVHKYIQQQEQAARREANPETQYSRSRTHRLVLEAYRRGREASQKIQEAARARRSR